MLAGAHFGKYEVLSGADGSALLLGRSAFAEFYKAINLDTARAVILKVFLPDALRDVRSQVRWEVAMNAWSQLRHPGIVATSTLCWWKDTAYCELELCENGDLRRLIERRGGPMDEPAVMQVAEQVAEALAYVHDQRWIHRDVKPSKIMLLSEGDSIRVKLTGFDLIQQIGALPEKDRRAVLYTPVYASPEQVCEEALDQRTDLFSLGMTLLHLLLGMTPVQGGLGRVLTERVNKGRSYESMIPDSMTPAGRALLKRLLEKDRDLRYLNARGYLDDLNSYFRQPGVAASSMQQLSQSLHLDADSTQLLEKGQKFSGWTAPSTAELEPLFEGYSLLAFLGQGGMGAVYKARQKNLPREVAIKLLPLEAGQNPEWVERFRREARALGLLRHPNIVLVYDSGTTAAGDLFFVMEFVDGCDLGDRLASGPLSPPDALKVMIQVCSALQAAHQRGVIHRDIKPKNILLDRNGTAKVADFGLAKIAEQNTSMTLTGTVMGTMDYMAPEQRDGRADARSDIYSMGVMLYELLVGSLPRGIFRRVSERVKVDPRFDDVVNRAMQEELDNRYQSVAEMRQDLEQIRQTLDQPPPPIEAFAEVGKRAALGERKESPHPPPPNPRANRRRWIAAATAAVTGTVGGAWWLGRRGHSDKGILSSIPSEFANHQLLGEVLITYPPATSPEAAKWLMPMESKIPRAADAFWLWLDVPPVGVDASVRCFLQCRSLSYLDINTLATQLCVRLNSLFRQYFQVQDVRKGSQVADPAKYWPPETRNAILTGAADTEFQQMHLSVVTGGLVDREFGGGAAESILAACADPFYWATVRYAATRAEALPQRRWAEVWMEQENSRSSLPFIEQRVAFARRIAAFLAQPSKWPSECRNSGESEISKFARAALTRLEEASGKLPFLRKLARLWENMAGESKESANADLRLAISEARRHGCMVEVPADALPRLRGEPFRLRLHLSEPLGAVHRALDSTLTLHPLQTEVANYPVEWRVETDETAWHRVLQEQQEQGLRFLDTLRKPSPADIGTGVVRSI